MELELSEVQRPPGLIFHASSVLPQHNMKDTFKLFVPRPCQTAPGSWSSDASNSLIFSILNKCIYNNITESFVIKSKLILNFLGGLNNSQLTCCSHRRNQLG